MNLIEINDFYGEAFKACFRAYFLEIGIRLREDTDVFDDITASYKNEQMRTLAIEDGGALAGFIMFQPEHLQGGFFEENAVFIRELWISPDYRRRGFGKLLIESVEERFKPQGAGKLLLTYQENALGFYEKLGFRPADTYKAKNNHRVIAKTF